MGWLGGDEAQRAEHKSRKREREASVFEFARRCEPLRVHQGQGKRFLEASEDSTPVSQQAMFAERSVGKFKNRGS